jgi:hypothetical protein
MCAAVNWKVCKSVIALFCQRLSVIKRGGNQGANKSNHLKENLSFCHAYHPTHDDIYYHIIDVQNNISYQADLPSLRIVSRAVEAFFPEIHRSFPTEKKLQCNDSSHQCILALTVSSHQMCFPLKCFFSGPKRSANH